jgi:hypothetical protein
MEALVVAWRLFRNPGVHRCGIGALALVATMASWSSQAQSPDVPAAASAPPMQSLGHDRYQIGQVVVDRHAHRLTFTARVAHLGEAPLEYLAVSRAGRKLYESLLEADATGSELNLGLILLGFDGTRSSRPAFQFDPHLPAGQRVAITVRWGTGRAARTVTADEALLDDVQRKAVEPSTWVYLGSIIRPRDGKFLADLYGTLIGFVHDPADVVDHQFGLGIGAYGSVRGNTSLLPPIGSAVEVVLTFTGEYVKPAEPPPRKPMPASAAPAGRAVPPPPPPDAPAAGPPP